MADSGKTAEQTIQDRAAQLVSDNAKLHDDYVEIEQMYFMEDAVAQRPSSSAHDPNDVKVTISPSARNDIVGVVRLLTTAEPQFEASSESDEGHLEDIVALCHAIVHESSRLSKGRVEVDAVRSTALYADTHLMASRLDDLIGLAGMPEEEVEALKDLRKRTPMLIEANSPANGYVAFGRFGMRAYLQRMQVRGDQIKDEWPLPAGVELDDLTNYYFNSWYDRKNRMVWLDEFKQLPLLPVAAHGLPFLPIAVGLADGSNLWNLPERIRQPFLYAKYRGSWYKRENLLYTQLFTALFERGSSILLGFDTEQPASDMSVDFAGPGVRIIKAPKPRLLSDTALDPALIQLKNTVLDPIDAESTIYKQVLGSSTGTEQMPYSSLAMLTQSGRLSTVAIQDSVQNAFSEILEKCMRWIKKQGIRLEGIVDMKPSDIPDDLEIKCTLEVKLPQDTFRNAQIAETLEKAGDVSHEWTQKNLLQIRDPKKMREEIWTEQSAEAFYRMLLAQATTPQAPVPTTPSKSGIGGVGGVNTPAGPGPEAAAAGGETLPASEALPPGPTYPPGGGA